jgi:hypothetical protein
LRNPKTDHRQQREKGAGPFDRLGQHRNFPPFEKLTNGHARVSDRQHDERPVTLEKPAEEPGHRQPDVHEQQHQHDLGDVNVKSSPAFAQIEWIVSR